MPRADAAGDVAADKNLVHSLAKGFRVLQAFGAGEPELTLAEAARAAGLDNATTFRLLNTLIMLGYVDRVAGTRRFRLTLKVLDLGFDAIARTDLRTLARPLLRELVGTDIEAASVAVIDGPDAVYVERVQAGLARLGIDVRIGTRVPAYSTAVGHAILANLPPERQVRLLDARPREKRTATTLTDIEALTARFALVRRQGYALSEQENVTGLRVLAAPVFDPDGVPVAALSVAAPAYPTPLDVFVERARDPVVEAAARLSRALSAAGSVALPRAAHPHP